MEKKNVFYALFLVSLMAVFAWMVLASTFNTTINNAGLASPIPRQNISSSFLLNVTAVGRGTATEGNFSWVNVSFINASLSWLYNITLYDNDSLVNQTFNITINSAGSSKLSSSALQEGVYNISINAHNTSDSVGLYNNTVFKSAGQFIVIDNTAPSITINTPDNASFIGSKGTFLFNITVTNDTRFTAVHYVNLSNNTGAGSSHQVWDKDGIDQDGGRFNITFNASLDLNEGENYLYAAANDTAGNLNNSKYIRVYVDTTAPTAINLFTPSNMTWTTDTTPDFVFNFSDATSPNASCSVFVDAGTVSATNTSAKNYTQTTLTAATALSLGIHTWGANCTDLGGNHQRSSLNYTIDIVEAPTLTAPANGTWISATGTTNNTINGTAFTFSFTSGLINTTQKGNVGCELFIMNESRGYNNTGINTTVLNGTSTILYNNRTLVEGTKLGWFVNCTYNNTIIISATSYINVDTLTPSAVYLKAFQTLRNWTWTDDSTPDLVFNFTDSVSATASCELFIDGAGYGVNSSARNYTETTITTNHSLSPGNHNWHVNCTDLGSNVGSSITGKSGGTSPVFTFDYELIAVTTPANGAWTTGANNGTTSFTFQYQSNLTDTNRFPKGLLNATCELFITNSSGAFLPNGKHSEGGVWNGTNGTINNTWSTITNNISLVHDLATNWTINCTFNGTQITVLDDSFYTLYVDNVTPTVSLSQDATLTTSSQIALTITTSSDAQTCTSNREGASMSGTGSSQTLTEGSLSPSTSYSFVVSCSDSSGRVGSASGTFSTDAGETGSGSGGSGGGMSSGVAAQFSQETWASINAGETATVEVKNGELGVTEVSFAVEKKTYGAWVKVEKVDALPSTVGAFVGKVYKNVKISERNVEKVLKDDKATVEFKVAKAWLTANKVGQASVALFRFADNAWNELTTTMGADDGVYIRYSAETPGFSYFVIGAKAAAPAPAAEEVTEEAAEEAVAEGVAEEVEEVAAAPPAKKNWLWLIPVAAAIAVLVWLVWFRKKKG